jgi:hypothetical protein
MIHVVGNHHSPTEKTGEIHDSRCAAAIGAFIGLCEAKRHSVPDFELLLVIGGRDRVVAIEWWELVVFRLVDCDDVCNQQLTTPLLDDDKTYAFRKDRTACEHVAIMSKFE